MDEKRIRQYLRHPLTIQCYDSLPSTNSLAKSWALQGAPQGSAVFADSQTAGRGRRGHSFYSPPGGLYMSLIVDVTGYAPGQLTTLAAVAAARSIAVVTGQQILIKWVNDLLQNGNKVGGILAEGILIEGRLSKSVIGIGLNTGEADFPPELSPTAGKLSIAGQPYDREQLAALIINEILESLHLIPAHMETYRLRCLTLGKQVSFLYEGHERNGIALDVDDNGELIVQTAKGDIRLLAGEVSLMKV